jgi:putative DNA primase/helicase
MDCNNNRDGGKILSVRAGGIPQELRTLEQWVLWRLETRDGDKPTKVPYRVDGRKASSTRSEDWSDFETVVKVYQRQHSRYSGIGFVLAKEREFVGIDLDHCRDLGSGTIASWAREILDRFSGCGYAEVSPSGTGIKLIVQGKLPIEQTGKRRDLPQYGPACRVEAYQHGRYFALTGHVVRGYEGPPVPAGDSLEWLWGHVLSQGNLSRGEDNGDLAAARSKPAPDILELARQHLATLPPAISGEAGHDTTFMVACTLVKGIGLSIEQAMSLMREYNQRCQPQWTEKELRHKVEDAARQPGPVGELLAQLRNVGCATAANSGHKPHPASPLGREALASWDSPLPVPCALPAVMPFDFDLLPESFRDWVRDIAARIQCPPDFPAVAAMIALAGVVGRKVGIRPKRRDDWTVVANLWGAVIGRPGIMKTPAINEPLKPLRRLEIEAKQGYEEAKQEFEAAKMVQDAAKKAAVKEIEKCLKNDRDQALEMARSAVKENGKPPVRNRYLVNDTTVEKLGEILNENPHGVTNFRDELVGLLRSLDKEGNECARAFFLESWNGTGRFTFDRIGRGTIDIASTTVSLLGGIQPGPFLAYMRQASQGGMGDDGLIQRFQLLVWPDCPKEWRNVDEWPDTGAKLHAYDVFTRLDCLDGSAIGAQVDDDDPEGIPYLRFCDRAQEFFDQWRAELEPRLRNDSEHPAMESHLAKYRSLIPSLALLIHLAEGGQGPIGLEPLQRAIAWARYLESHARRVYDSMANPSAASARVLAKKLLAGELQDGFALRDVYRPCWSGLTEKEDAMAAVELLIDLNWLQAVTEPTGGRPKTIYFINPKIYELREDMTAKTDKSPNDDASVSSDSDLDGTCDESPLAYDGNKDEEETEWDA